jgi:hypothetical protein
MQNMVIEFILLLLTMAALQIKHLNVIVQNCCLKKNDRCLGTYKVSQDISEVELLHFMCISLLA